MIAAVILGIDPGKTGGMAAMDDAGQVISRLPIPTLATGVGSRRDYDEGQIVVWLRQFMRDRVAAFLESQQAYPGQGAVSNFSTGGGYYLWRGILAALGISYEIVRPQTWQKAMLDAVSGDTKARAVATCKRLFPDVDLRVSERGTKPHDGVADALLIAEFGRRRLAGR